MVRQILKESIPQRFSVGPADGEYLIGLQRELAVSQCLNVGQIDHITDATTAKRWIGNTLCQISQLFPCAVPGSVVKAYMGPMALPFQIKYVSNRNRVILQEQFFSCVAYSGSGSPQ